jgi:hypothetical protein
MANGMDLTIAPLLNVTPSQTWGLSDSSRFGAFLSSLGRIFTGLHALTLVVRETTHDNVLALSPAALVPFGCPYS